MENPPKCKDCGQPMVELGETGKIITGNVGNNVWGRSQKLYQCPEDKTVALG